MSETARPRRQRQGARALRARRRAAAARRQRPDLDLRRRPADRDPRQGPRAHRPVRVLVRADARDSAPNHLLALRAGRPLDRVPAAGDAAARVRRARLPRRLGLEGLPRDRRDVCGHALPDGLRESDRLPEPIFTPSTKATTGPRREHRRASRRPSSSARERFERGRARRRSRSTASPPSTPPRAGSSSPTRSSSSASTTTGELVLADEALTPDSSRFWPADEYAPGGAAAVVRQAVRPRLLRVARLGQDRPRPGAARRRRRRARARATSRRSSG